MKKFSFELQGILDVKEQLESQAKNNFAAAQAKLNEEEEKRAAIETRRVAYKQRLAESVNGILDLLEISRLRDAIDVLTEEFNNQELVCRRAEKQVDLAREKLNLAIRERKTLEKLKEKKFEDYRKEYNAEEAKLVDELISYKHSKAE